MPGVLVDDAYADPALSHLLRPRCYIPAWASSTMPGFPDQEGPPTQLSTPNRPAYLNVTSLLDMHADDGTGLRLSPSGQWRCNSVSPTTVSALSVFLPSNFEEDGERGNTLPMDMYSCDDFRMYEFKVRRCMRGRSHDWTDCPFAHPGEKARRRDPRKFHYSGITCPEFRRGGCKKGDSCEYAHGVFESWLHPTRYRTQPCKDGPECRRRICFFAHTPEQLRLIASEVSSPSALSSPTLSHLEAFEGCMASSPFRSPSKKASSPLCRMAMEVHSEGYSPLAIFSSPAVSKSLSMSSSTALIDWSPKGVTAFALPAAAMPTQASFVLPPTALCSQRERHGGCLAPPVLHTQKPALPLSASYMAGSTPSRLRADNFLCFLKSEEMPVGHVGDDELEEEGGLKLERVESGKGLRAQIFQSLLRSTSQPSCRTYQDSSSEPLRTSSSLGY